MTMPTPDPTKIASDLEEPAAHARELAKRLGLDPYPVNYWIVDHDEMNQLIAYEGFTERYPHWRWGMQYDRQQKTDRYHAGKAFEIVNNDNPANAFLQESNALADQKAVITHVLAHADFFKHNEWFDTIAPEDPGPSTMLARHAERIRGYTEDPSVDPEAVEQWIDHVLSITDTIDQRRTFQYGEPVDRTGGRDTTDDERSPGVDDLGVSDEVRDAIFDEEWRAAQEVDEDGEPAPYGDVLAYLRAHGKQYDSDTGRAQELEDWQRDVIELLRAEAYYFAPQRMTKVANEGWSAYWESIMMSAEGFADAGELFTYADHMAKVLGGGGLNPYELGKRLWEYVENVTNRREVLERLLRVEGITWRSLHDAVDFAEVRDQLAPPPALETITADGLDELAQIDPTCVDRDALERARAGEIDLDRYPWKVLTYEGLARRNYSLLRPQHRGFLSRVSDTELEKLDRYLFENDRYATVEEALDDVAYTAGWDRMREVRESHNDVTFIDEFLTEEFVREQAYFSYEYAFAEGGFRVSSTDYADIKRKLLLLFTNFGKPRIVVADGNYDNRNELLLAHQYNGIMLDIEEAEQTLERVFELWGRPVNLKTIVKTVNEETIDEVARTGSEPDPNEEGMLIRYDGAEFERSRLPWEAVEDIAATELDYSTKPDDWLA